MRKHSSILMLLVRSTMYPILGLLCLLVVVESGIFLALMQNQNSLTLNSLMQSGWLWRGAWVILLLITILLCRTGCEFGSKCGYTLRRLMVSERQIFFWQAVYNTGIYLLFWAVEMAVLLGLGFYYIKRQGFTELEQQLLFLTTYRSALFHSLLPLRDVSRWVCTAVLFAGLGVTSAAFPIRHRYKKYTGEVVLLVGAMLFWFPGAMGGMSQEIMTGIAFAALGFMAIVRVWDTVEGEDDHETTKEA